MTLIAFHEKQLESSRWIEACLREGREEARREKVYKQATTAEAVVEGGYKKVCVNAGAGGRGGSSPSCEMRYTPCHDYRWPREQ